MKTLYAFFFCQCYNRKASQDLLERIDEVTLDDITSVAQKMLSSCPTMASWGDGLRCTLSPFMRWNWIWVVIVFSDVSAVDKVPTHEYVQKLIESPPSDLMWMLKSFFSWHQLEVMFNNYMTWQLRQLVTQPCLLCFLSGCGDDLFVASFFVDPWAVYSLIVQNWHPCLVHRDCGICEWDLRLHMAYERLDKSISVS
jgi:hypothetical protein